MIRTGISLAATCRAVRQHPLHRRALADDPLESALFGQLVAENLVLLLQRGALGRAVHLRPKMIQIQRLFDEPVRPLVHCLHGNRNIPVRGNQNHRRRRSQRLGLVQHFQAVALPSITRSVTITS